MHCSGPKAVLAKENAQYLPVPPPTPLILSTHLTYLDWSEEPVLRLGGGGGGATPTERVRWWLLLKWRGEGTTILLLAPAQAVVPEASQNPPSRVRLYGLRGNVFCCSGTSKFRSVETPGYRPPLMAQPQDLSVARAVFTAALLRAEPGAPEISRDNATLFARSILRTCNICTAFNIKVGSRGILPSTFAEQAAHGPHGRSPNLSSSATFSGLLCGHQLFQSTCLPSANPSHLEMRRLVWTRQCPEMRTKA